MSPVNLNAVGRYPDAFGSARQGVDRGLAAADQAAQAVASDGSHGVVSARNTTDALTARNEVAASVRVLETADQMLGTLLDVRA